MDLKEIKEKILNKIDDCLCNITMMSIDEKAVEMAEAIKLLAETYKILDEEKQ